MSNLVKFPSLSRKIVAVGRNYAEHAAELGNAVPSKPLLFMKPPSSYITAGENIEIPLGCQELHHEIELGVVISKQCKRVSPDQAMEYVGGYCIALDMTARDFQVTVVVPHITLSLNVNLIFRTRLKLKAIPGRWPRCSTPVCQ